MKWNNIKFLDYFLNVTKNFPLFPSSSFTRGVTLLFTDNVSYTKPRLRIHLGEVVLYNLRKINIIYYLRGTEIAE